MKDGPPAGQVGVHQVVGVDLDRDHLVDGDQKQLLAKPRPAEPHSCGTLEAAGPARAWFLERGRGGVGLEGWRESRREQSEREAAGRQTLKDPSLHSSQK